MFELINDTVALNAFLLDKATKTAESLIIIIIGYFLIRWMDKILDKIFDRTPWDKALEKFLQSMANISAWVIVFLMVLSVFDVDLAPMLASLGIAGFVLGFALKDTLGNLASGVMLLVYRPFTVGHFVEINGIKGSVKKIGISACTLNTPDNKKITIPNSGVWGNPITNYSAHSTRRLDIDVGISYSDDIDKALKVALRLLKKRKEVLAEPEPLVAVSGLGDSSVNLVLRYWLKREDYWDSKFSVTQLIKEEFDKNGISIPFPQTDVHLIAPQKAKRKATKKVFKKKVTGAYADED